MSDEPTLADELEVMLGTGPEAVDWADWEGWSRRAITRIAELEAMIRADAPGQGIVDYTGGTDE